MSTDYDLYCVTCDTDLGVQWTSGDTILKGLWAQRDTVIAYAAIEPKLRAAGFGIEHHYMGGFDRTWFAIHRDHDVRVKDEYGVVDNRCGQWIRCQCGRSCCCIRKRNHEGKCDVWKEMADL